MRPFTKLPYALILMMSLHLFRTPEVHASDLDQKKARECVVNLIKLLSESGGLAVTPSQIQGTPFWKSFATLFTMGRARWYSFQAVDKDSNPYVGEVLVHIESFKPVFNDQTGTNWKYFCTSPSAPTAILKLYQPNGTEIMTINGTPYDRLAE